MVQLLNEDIKTREVRDWQGVHLLHFVGSSCSQKTRIFLNLKGIDWISHPVDLVKQENFSSWFLGINPRGLVPVLVHDGEVHIESNDILEYLEALVPSPALIPDAHRQTILDGLREEDDLHMDIRNLTMRFLAPAFLIRKKPAALERLRQDAGTVEGRADPHKQVELGYWEDFARQGITDEQARESANKFRAIYQSMEETLSGQAYLTGEDITLLDIAWFIYTHRLTTTGYPFGRLHPRVDSWYRKLLQNEAFAKEVVNPLPLQLVSSALHVVQGLRGSSLARIAGL